MKLYIVIRHKNANKSRTRWNFEILIPDSDSGGRNTSSRRVSKKSEPKNFSTFKGGAGGYAMGKLKNGVHIRDPRGHMYKIGG